MRTHKNLKNNCKKIESILNHMGNFLRMRTANIKVVRVIGGCIYCYQHMA